MQSGRTDSEVEVVDPFGHVSVATLLGLAPSGRIGDNCCRL